MLRYWLLEPWSSPIAAVVLLIRGWQSRYRGNSYIAGGFQAKLSSVCFSTRRFSVGSNLSGREPMRDQEVKFLVGTTAG